MNSSVAIETLRLHRRGVLMILASALMWSVAGLFTRLIPLDLWTMQFGRSLAGGVFLLVLALAQNGRAAPGLFVGIGALGLAAVPILAASMLCFVAALKTTTVAQVMIVYATQPFASAAVAWVWLGEPMGRRTLLASMAALAGIAISLIGAPWGGPWLGSLLSLMMVLTFAFVMVLARGRHEISTNALTCLACLACSAFCWPLSQSSGLTVHNIALLAVFGFATVGLGLTLLMAGARHVPSGEASLLSTLDIPLSPLWVWLAFGEQPPLTALIGGAVVLAALAWHLTGGEAIRLTFSRAPPEA